MKRARILLYSHDTYGLGHIRRSLAIAQSISQHIPRSRQLLLTGSTVAGAFGLPPRLDMVKLPALTKRSSGEYMPRALPLSLEHTVRWRSEMILNAVRHFEPDLILVDKSPAGVHGELRPSLELIARRYPKTRVVLGMRDIEDSPEATRQEWRARDIYTILDEFYDALLLYGQRSVFDPVSAYELPAQVAGKLVECGYIRKEVPARSLRRVRREFGLGGDPFVLITAGGGGDGFALLDTALKMFEQGLGDGLNPLLVTGPLMPQQHRVRLAERAAAIDLNLVEFTPRLMDFMAAADLVISMAGYNTVCEILTLGKRAILVPRAQVRQEQRIRAQRLAGLGLAHTLSPEQLSPENLHALVRESLAAAPPSVHLNMDGLAQATRAIASLLRASPGSPYRIPAAAARPVANRPAA